MKEMSGISKFSVKWIQIYGRTHQFDPVTNLVYDTLWKTIHSKTLNDIIGSIFIEIREK